MAQTIKLKRSGTEGNIPTTSQLELGEVAINTYDGKMFIKKNVGGTESIVEISAAAADAILVEYQFTSTASQTTYSGSDDNTETLSYTPNAIQVFMNGILLDPGIDFTATNGTSIVLSEAADANDYLQIFAFKKKISDGQVSVDTFTGDDSTVAFTLSVDPGDENNTRVFIDGVYQSKSNYSVSGTTLTFSTAPPTGTAVEVEIGNRVVTLDTLSDLDLPDDVKLRLGTDQDLQIYHDGSNSYIDDTGTGDLYIRANNLRLQNADGSEGTVYTNNGGNVELYYAGSKKLETSNDGVTVTGDVEADEFIGDVRGAVLFKAQAGESLAKGEVVYISGISGNTTIVSKADADDASKMPAFGLVAAAASSGNPVDIYTNGILSGIDTSSYSEGDELFVSTTAGALTATPPTGESSALQKIGKVTRSASSGSIFIVGAGRSNAVPNLDDGDIFLGNSSNQAVSASLNTKIEEYLDSGVSTPTFAGLATTANMTFGDNDKAIFGAGSDLQIYHDGLNSIIADKGTGHLQLTAPTFRLRNDSQTQEMLSADEGGAVTAYYSGSQKFATTSTGIDVTGTVLSDGLRFGTTTDHTIKWGSGAEILGIGSADQSVHIRLDPSDASNFGNFKVTDGSSNKNLLFVDDSGDISFYEDTGTTAKFFWDSSAESLSVGSSSSTTDRRFQVTGSGVSTATSQFGIVNNPTYPTGVTANIFNLYTGPNLTSGTTLNNLYNLYLESNNKTGSTVTNSFGLYQAGSGDKNYFAGNVGIGNTNPLQKLSVNGNLNVDTNQDYYGSWIVGNSATNGYSYMAVGEWYTAGLYIQKKTGENRTHIYNYNANHPLIINAGSSTYGETTSAKSRLGIGTFSPNAVVHILGQNPSGLIVENGTGIASTQPYVSMAANNYSSGFGTFRWEDQRASQASPSFIWEVRDGSGTTLAYDFRTGATGAAGSKLAITQSGNVGIGTNSPAAPLHVSSTGHAHIFEGTGGNVSLKLQRSDASGAVDFGDIQFVNNTAIAARINSRGEGSASGNLTFQTRNTSGTLAERARITSAGYLLVGKTDTTFSTSGIELRNANLGARFTRNFAEPIFVNRTGNNGDIIKFYGDTVEIGKIGSALGDSSVSTLFIADAGNVGIRFDQASTDDIQPCTSAGADRDNAINLGASDNRFKDLYLSGGVYLGGTASANRLHDYEEGNWDPTIVGNSGASGQSYNFQNGKYTKIGSFIHATFDVRLSTMGTLSGTYVVIGGLPFNGNSSNLGGTALITYVADVTSAGLDFPISAYISGSNIYLMETGQGADYILTSENHITNSTRLIGSIFMHQA